MPEMPPECYECARRLPLKTCPTCKLPLCERCRERHKERVDERNARTSLGWTVLPALPSWYTDWAEEEMRKIKEWQDTLFLASATRVFDI